MLTWGKTSVKHHVKGGNSFLPTGIIYFLEQTTTCHDRLSPDGPYYITGAIPQEEWHQSTSSTWVYFYACLM